MWITSQPTPEHTWMKQCSVYWRDIEGQKEGGGRTPEHWIYRTGGDIKLEVRNNWCNAGERRRGLVGGRRGVRVRPLQCFAVGEHQSIAHLAAISAFRHQGDPVLWEQRMCAGLAALYTANCTMQHYSPLLLTQLQLSCLQSLYHLSVLCKHY